MKVFTGRDGKIWEHKLNFVDSNNVILGFDNTQDCCEQFGWYVNTNQGANRDDKSTVEGDETYTPSLKMLEPYNFDIHYHAIKESQDYSFESLCEFKLVADGLPDLYLTLFNIHEGYYSHGFDFSVDGKLKYSGSL